LSKKKEINEEIKEELLEENNESIEVVQCKILYWNKYSKVLGFDYKGINIQITVDKEINVSKGIVNVKFIDGKYELI
jgi:hypothetical protein